MFNKFELEEIATSLRETLEIDSETILNPSHLEELCEKIEKHFECFKIVKGLDSSVLVLENGENFTIYIDGGIEAQFYDLVRMFTFAIVLDKKSLNYYQLQKSVYTFPRHEMNRGADEYLMLAFMMPEKVFRAVALRYSSADCSRIDMFKMQEEVNKYCFRRGIDLQMWIA